MVTPIWATTLWRSAQIYNTEKPAYYGAIDGQAMQSWEGFGKRIN